ncbi:InlB B-repeat-containing protein [Mycoplasmatota bacterium]|nr:InlB B-repeat-containing protein [Mycoplasmatota bacterium]
MFTYDIFECFKGTEGDVEIVGLTEEGLQLEVVEFPAYIEGYSYVGIGGFSFGPDKDKGIDTDQMKIAILSGEDTIILPEAFRDSSKLEKIVINSLSVMEVGGYAIPREPGRIITVYVPFEVYDEYYSGTEWDDYRDLLKRSTVSFYYNYDNSPNQDLFWTSQPEKGDKIDKPTDPSREGYIFKGWFTEKETINEWDFENEAEVRLQLFAKWVRDSEGKQQ